jgi:hypothetical protein
MKKLRNAKNIEGSTVPVAFKDLVVTYQKPLNAHKAFLIFYYDTTNDFL